MVDFSRLYSAADGRKILDYTWHEESSINASPAVEQLIRDAKGNLISVGVDVELTPTPFAGAHYKGHMEMITAPIGFDIMDWPEYVTNGANVQETVLATTR